MTLHPLMFQPVIPTEDQSARLETMRTAFMGLMKIIDDNVPDGPDRTYIVRQIRGASMWCSYSIMRNPDGSPRG
jgi:hypothetical protein